MNWVPLRISATFCAVLMMSGCTGAMSIFKDWFNLEPERVSPFPERPSNAPTGSAFMKATQNYLPNRREEAIYREIARGNIPSHLRRLRTITVKTRGKRPHTGKLWVTNDYLAIGSDDDFVRIPMTPMTAQRLADRFGYLLPTKKIVDEIYLQADVRLKPQPLRPGPLMITNGFYLWHQQLIERQLAGRGHHRLLAGHKKDVVLSNKIWKRPNRVAIYGWHRSPRRPIQPLSIFHIDSYADYSHGIRFVHRFMEVDGKSMRVADVLRTPDLAGLISDEGIIAKVKVAEITRMEKLQAAQ